MHILYASSYRVTVTETLLLCLMCRAICLAGLQEEKPDLGSVTWVDLYEILQMRVLSAIALDYGDTAEKLSTALIRRRCRIVVSKQNIPANESAAQSRANHAGVQPNRRWFTAGHFDKQRSIEQNRTVHNVHCNSNNASSSPEAYKSGILILTIQNTWTINIYHVNETVQIFYDIFIINYIQLL